MNLVMRFSKTIIIFSLILISCGSNPKENFTIDFIKKSEFTKKGNKIEFSISNTDKKDITDLKFFINDKIVISPHIINNNPGYNTLNASFIFDNKKDIIDAKSMGITDPFKKKYELNEIS